MRSNTSTSPKSSAAERLLGLAAEVGDAPRVKRNEIMSLTSAGWRTQRRRFFGPPLRRSPAAPTARPQASQRLMRSATDLDTGVEVRAWTAPPHGWPQSAFSDGGATLFPTQTVLPSVDTAAMLFSALQVTARKHSPSSPSISHSTSPPDQITSTCRKRATQTDHIPDGTNKKFTIL